MPTICKDVATGSYLESLRTFHPQLKPEDIWSLICCGGDLHHPYEGWAGIVAYPVYSDARPFTLFFGEFTEQLMQWENVPEFRIERGTSKIQAFSDFRTYITSVTNNPVFVSANAATWALRIFQEAIRLDTQGPWNAQLICLRDLYSKTENRLALERTGYIGQAFQKSPPLPKTFGLHKIGLVLGVEVPELSDKATYRSQLTAECAYRLLERVHPEETDED